MNDLIRFETPEMEGWKDENGNLHGEFRRYYEDGNLKMIAHYDHGRREGLSVELDDDGNWEVLLWHNHTVVQVLQAMLQDDPSELVGFVYPFMGR